MDELKYFMGKKVIFTRRYPERDTVYIEYEDYHPMLGHRISWAEINGREAEKLGLVEKTLRYHRKPQAQIDRENRNIIWKQRVVLFLVMCMCFFAIMDENVVGTGVSLGIFFSLLLIYVYDPKTTDTYEKRL